MSEEVRQVQGQLVRMTADGELIPQPEATSFDQILIQAGGRPSREVRTTYDASTVEGKQMLLRHMQSVEVKGTKDAVMNVPFKLIGATSWPVRVTKDQNGDRLAEPKLLIRTVLETDQGELIPSSSAYVYESLQMIQDIFGKATPQNPIAVKIGKAGAADKLFALDVQPVAKGGKQLVNKGKQP